MDQQVAVRCRCLQRTQTEQRNRDVRRFCRADCVSALCWPDQLIHSLFLEPGPGVAPRAAPPAGDERLLPPSESRDTSAKKQQTALPRILIIPATIIIITSPPQRQSGAAGRARGVFTDSRTGQSWRPPVRATPPHLPPLFSLDAPPLFTAPPPRRSSPVRSGGGTAELFPASRMADREASPIPLEIRARLAELELELSEGKDRRGGGISIRTGSPTESHPDVCQAAAALCLRFRETLLGPEPSLFDLEALTRSEPTCARVFNHSAATLRDRAARGGGGGGSGLQNS